MQSYEIETVPCVQFAHVYSADTYSNILADREDSMEISYISLATQSIAGNIQQN